MLSFEDLKKSYWIDSEIEKHTYDLKSFLRLSVNPIVCVHTNGGIIAELAAICTLFQIYRPAVVVIGKAYSSGCILTSFGKPGQRYATQQSEFLLHHARGATKHPHLDEIWEYRDGNMMAAFSSTTKKDLDFWMKKIEAGFPLPNPKDPEDKMNDFYFSPKQALEWGVVDHILK